jgi:hypothetical protein
MILEIDLRRKGIGIKGTPVESSLFTLSIVTRAASLRHLVGDGKPPVMSG